MYEVFVVSIRTEYSKVRYRHHTFCTAVQMHLHVGTHTVANPPVRPYIQPADRFPGSLPNDPMTFFYYCFLPWLIRLAILSVIGP